VKARIVSIVTVLSTCLVISGPAFAHHSMSMYDRGHETTFKATITQLLGQSAHADHFHRHRWPRQRREMGGGRSRSDRLANHGWSKDSLKPGDEITIIGNRNRDGSPTMRFEKVIFPNGQELEARPHFF